ncbi:MAG: bifunctional non-ous end joining protein LigD [Gaiellales bacterium]|nr:bifunctional non-ous end joining protein LigD [Gaiellales bacterium]
MSKPTVISVGNRTLKLTNLDKVLYPKAGFTKGDVIEYYRTVAPTLLPHLKDRPLTMKRYPNGVDEQFFYQKEAPQHRPPWVKTVPIWSRGNKRDVNFLLVNNLSTLIWIANLADLELHTSLSKASNPKRPTMMVFDLDPGAPATIVECCEVGLMLRDLIGGLGLTAFPKTSGSKGLQVYVPLNTPVTYDDTKPFAHTVARRLEEQHPDLILSNMRKDLRMGKVLVDWSQNDDMKTTICVYSLRARERPTVSTPVTWDEVEETASSRDPGSLVFECKDALERVDRLGDLFAPVLHQRQRLPNL